MTRLLIFAFVVSGAAAVVAQTGTTESLLREQVRLHPENFDDNARLGEYYLKHGKWADALPYLEKAHRLDPSDYADAYDLAQTYLQTKAPSHSRELVKELLQQGDKAELHNLLGDIEEADHHVDEAARQYELAARLDPSEKNLFDLGTDLLNHRGFSPALKAFMYAVQRYPTSARLHVGLGVAYYSLGRYDEAVETLCQAVDLDPQDTRALDFLGKMAEISPKYAEAVTKRLAGFVRAYPRSAVAQYYYGVALRKHNLAPSSAHDREAEPYLARAVQLKPDFPEAHFELGTLYQDRGEDAKAIRQLEIATLQRPQFLPAHYRLARLYQKVGRRDMARHEFARIEELKERVAKSAQ